MGVPGTDGKTFWDDADKVKLVKALLQRGPLQAVAGGVDGELWADHAFFLNQLRFSRTGLARAVSRS
jgi:hypothetical protein